jgi:hypothetical protein
MEEKLIEIVADILFKHGEKIADETRKLIKQKKKVNTGALEQSVKFQVEVRDQIISLSLSMVEYGAFVNDGRKAGKFPNVEAIRTWVRQKGLTMKRKSKMPRDKEVKTLAYLIGRKISRVGIKPVRIVPRVDVQLIRLEILQAIKQYLTVEMKTTLSNIITRD